MGKGSVTIWALFTGPPWPQRMCALGRLSEGWCLPKRMKSIICSPNVSSIFLCRFYVPIIGKCDWIQFCYSVSLILLEMMVIFTHLNSIMCAFAPAIQPPLHAVWWNWLVLLYILSVNVWQAGAQACIYRPQGKKLKTTCNIYRIPGEEKSLFQMNSLQCSPAGLHLTKPPLLLTGIPIWFKVPALTLQTHISSL